MIGWLLQIMNKQEHVFEKKKNRLEYLTCKNYKWECQFSYNKADVGSRSIL